MEKYKVMNDYDITIALNFRNLDGRVVKVLPRSFAYINEDQLMFLTNSSKILQSGLLRIEEKAKTVDEVEESIDEANIFSKERIESLMGLTVTEIKEAIKPSDNLLGLKKLLAEAEKRESAKGFIKAIEDKIQELM